MIFQLPRPKQICGIDISASRPQLIFGIDISALRLQLICGTDISALWPQLICGINISASERSALSLGETPSYGAFKGLRGL